MRLHARHFVDFAFLAGLAAVLMLLSACEDMYPEVVVTHALDEPILIRNISFNGCKWDGMLAYEDSTSPGRCLTGSDRIHFQKFDSKAYCREQVADGTLDDLCFCDEEDRPDDAPLDSGLINEKPMWFNYQTKRSFEVHGGFHHFLLTPDDMEQDFSVPGPYGH